MLEVVYDISNISVFFLKYESFIMESHYTTFIAFKQIKSNILNLLDLEFLRLKNT